MKLRISHRTVYRYQQPIRNLVQSLRLTPSVFEGQRTHDWQIDVTGGIRGPGFRDGAGDWIEGWTLRGPAEEVTVSIEGRVDTRDTAGVLRGHREIVHPLTYLRDSPTTAPDPGLRDLAQSVQAQDPLDLAHALSRAISDAIAFRPGVTQTQTTAAEALALGEGVCQDHTHALIAVARLRDMPARYVSGYLHSTIDGEAHDAAHAWAEIHVQGLGWVGFDAANRSCPDERYVRLGSGFDASDAAPIRGVAMGSGAEDMDVRVQVEEMAQ
ncbi:transglutaminase family protein [Paracoccus aestuarii]|uniref:Transglutaminase family protein n=1 Tax=Paracoccus aestuarii TaxID=453842 RepID=A0A418ZYG9_9RHOB|nr:transglutaminase family protein [Paracoccus aestuarii]RJL05575.1 transglutaminase family protein [Paracoccus aestuarii]WCQ99436.1 transglutaminase family protein [Paracoccus aestuarii]